MHIPEDSKAIVNSQRITHIRLEVGMSARLKGSVVVIVLDYLSVYGVRKDGWLFTDRDLLLQDSWQGELVLDDFQILSAGQCLWIVLHILFVKQFAGPREELARKVRRAGGLANLRLPLNEPHEVVEVRVLKEALILHKVFDLLEIQLLKRRDLKVFQVLRVLVLVLLKLWEPRPE